VLSLDFAALNRFPRQSQLRVPALSPQIIHLDWLASHFPSYSLEEQELPLMQGRINLHGAPFWFATPELSEGVGQPFDACLEAQERK